MDNYPEITEFFKTLIEQSHSIDVAEAEFKRIMADDACIKADYREWCSENGHNPRSGFRDYAEEYLADNEDIWNALNDYDNEDE